MTTVYGRRVRINKTSKIEVKHGSFYYGYAKLSYVTNVQKICSFKFITQKIFVNKGASEILARREVFNNS